MLRTSRVLFLIALAMAAGCAHSRAPEPTPSPAASAPDTASGDVVSGDANAPGPAALDPSEVITEEELATIPNPVPGGADEPPPRATPIRESPTPSNGMTSGDPSSWIWSVQIFASPDRAQAERTAREASERLGENYVLDREDALYKVRLGAFHTEAEAEPLKRRAVLEGYSGAFRVRTMASR